MRSHSVTRTHREPLRLSPATGQIKKIPPEAGVDRPMRAIAGLVRSGLLGAHLFGWGVMRR